MYSSFLTNGERLKLCNIEFDFKTLSPLKEVVLEFLSFSKDLFEKTCVF